MNIIALLTLITDTRKVQLIRGDYKTLENKNEVRVEVPFKDL
jgi:hypothetical protein